MNNRHSTSSVPSEITGPLHGLLEAFLHWRDCEELGASEFDCERAENSFRAFARDICGMPDFDRMLDDASESVSSIPGFDHGAFMSVLLSEAAGMDFSDINGKLLRADLFFVPVNGPIEDIEQFVGANTVALTGTFRASGLASVKSNVVVTPILIDQTEACSMTPGQMRSALELLLPPLSGENKGRVDVPTLRRHLGVRQEYQVGKESPVADDRLILCARLGVLGKKTDERVDALTAGLIENIEETPYSGDWLDLVREVKWENLIVSMPSSLPRGMAAMAINRAQTALTSEAIRAGLYSPKGFDEIHMAKAGETVLIEATLSGHRLGPIDVPSQAVIMDPDWFMDELDEMAGDTILHEDVMFMPQSSAPRN